MNSVDFFYKHFLGVDINKIVNDSLFPKNDYTPPQFYNYTHITITINDRYWERNVFRKRFRSRLDCRIKRRYD